MDRETSEFRIALGAEQSSDFVAEMSTVLEQLKAQVIRELGAECESQILKDVTSRCDLTISLTIVSTVVTSVSVLVSSIQLLRDLSKRKIRVQGKANEASFEIDLKDVPATAERLAEWVKNSPPGETRKAEVLITEPEQ